MASRADDYLLQCSKAIPDEILDAAEVFWSRLRKLENGCWVYGNSTREYGDFRGFSAHRVAYTLMFGAVQLGLVVAHKCDNKPCCNPEHLEAVTFGKNIRDAYLRGLIPRAKGDSISSVLTTEFVLKIIELRSQGLGSKRIAKALNLPWRAVEKVISGRTWNHITGLEKPSDLVDGAPASTIKTRRRRAVCKLEAAS